MTIILYNSENFVKELKALYSVGQSLQVCVLKVDIEKNEVIASARSLEEVRMAHSKLTSTSQPPSLTVSTGNRQTLHSFHIGQIHSVHIVDLAFHGGYAAIIGNATRGRIAWTDWSDDYSANRPKVGDDLMAKVIGIDHAKAWLDLSSRQSDLNEQSQENIQDLRVQTISGLQQGQSIRGFVVNIANSGLFVSLGRTVTARVQIKVRPKFFSDFFSVIINF